MDRRDALPPAALLGAGEMRVRLSAAGTGGTWYGEHALTRWRPDPVEDRFGWRFQVYEPETGACWPIGRGGPDDVPARFDAVAAPGRFTIERAEDGIETRLEVCVDPAASRELRRVTLVNTGRTVRTIQLASMFEVSLQHPAADTAHPAFSKLFVQTSWDAPRRALLARRRPRGGDERHPWMLLAAPGTDGLEWETDRARHLGRGDLAHRRARLAAPGVFAGSTGNVLDPVFAIRRRVALDPGASAVFDFVLAAAPERDAVLGLAADLDPPRVAALFAAAEAAERERQAALGLGPGRAAFLQALGAAALEGRPALRGEREAFARAAGSIDALRRMGLDPAQPLVFAEGEAVPLALEALRYWRALGWPFQLLVQAGAAAPSADPADGVHLASAAGEGAADLLLARAAACWAPASGTAPRLEPAPAVPPVDRARPLRSCDGGAPAGGETLRAANGLGGFSADGREYVIRVSGVNGHGRPPQPWVNVIANERIGFLISESGAASTWGANSREYRLTPWSNDPVLDPYGEALYVRDLDDATFWSPMPGPVACGGEFEVRHAMGESRFRHTHAGIEHDTRLFVAREDPVRFCRVRLVNRSPRTRRLSLAAYQRLVLGALPESDGRFAVTSRDAASGALFATSAVGDAFARRVAFAQVVAPDGAARPRVTTDRAAFLGVPGDPRRPAAFVRGEMLDGVTGAGLDPCFAFDTAIELAPGEEVERTFLLGDAADAAEARALLARHATPAAVEAAHGEALAFWQNLVDGLQIETPEPALDLMVNAWLPYQALSGRMLGRTAFYQSSGAYGFRDQLQDASGFTLLDPDRFRRQILLHAAHQFVEGDVLHWWHPPLDRGMRTRFADDLLWLPWLTAGYVGATGDVSVLEERRPLLTARALAPGEAEAFVEPRPAGRTADVYTHACMAIDRSLTTGAHGLPLFGTGDWNDGMNRVGQAGRGESVWMAFFLIAVIDAFAPLCERRGDGARAARYRAHAATLREAVEANAWDGEWYLRAFDDDGVPLGTHADTECRIDGLVQAWSVISGAAPPARAAQALDAVERHLISEREGLIRLLTPPFENTPRDPGYIKGYVKGVRENGGQYTHAALWIVRALAEAGRTDRAAPLLAMLSPVHHAADPAGVATYRVEPYVVAADVYGAEPHVGRGGWTWYTGSASWMYRVAVESVLGIEWVNGDQLRLTPRIPDAWPACRVTWRVPGAGATYQIEYERAAPGRASGATVDGSAVPVHDGVTMVPIARDGGTHRVIVTLGAANGTRASASGRRGAETVTNPATARGAALESGEPRAPRPPRPPAKPGR